MSRERRLCGTRNPWRSALRIARNGRLTLFRAAIYSVAVNYLGLPAGVVPAGRAAELPAGVQIIGRRFREDLILDAMEAIETRLGVMAKTLWGNALSSE